jgi:hypothetical protein
MLLEFGRLVNVYGMFIFFPPSIMAGQHYCLRWNNYQSNMTSVFHQLLRNEAFVDVTLACNDSSLKAHKVHCLNTAFTFNFQICQYLL